MLTFYINPTPILYKPSNKHPFDYLIHLVKTHRDSVLGISFFPSYRSYFQMSLLLSCISTSNDNDESITPSLIAQIKFSNKLVLYHDYARRGSLTFLGIACYCGLHFVLPSARSIPRCEITSYHPQTLISNEI